MNDSERGLAAAVLGAVVGGIAGYLLLTEHGRNLRRRLEPALEDFGHELGELRGTVTKAMGVASQGWHVLDEAMREREESLAFPAHRRSNPF